MAASLGDGSLRVRIDATSNETTLAGIMRLVEEAQQSESKTQMLVDGAAGWLFYVALAAAVVTAIAWCITVQFNSETVERVVTVLVIACSHALGLAIPLVVAINTSLGANNGMHIRNRIAIEQARDLDTIAFERAGTETDDYDLVELNEAFASQILYFQQKLGFDDDIFNVNGGSIAIGHPRGVSGATITVTLIHEMHRRNAELGLATECVGYGQGAAIVFSLPN